MFVLDTNVLSELMNPAGAASVVTWADGIPRPDLFTTAINQAEILFGLAVMAKGQRRSERLAQAKTMFEEIFSGRILPFGQEAAPHYAEILAHRQSLGRPVQPVDVQIAAIARAYGMTVVTRNVKDFADCGIEILNPWD
jgi:predicted nucleic acid-binding protein